MIIKKGNAIEGACFSNCHDGEGELVWKPLLMQNESDMFLLMDYDLLKAGVSIGAHQHTHNEEIYYLLSGKGVLTYDGEEIEMEAGDVSLCKIGSSHGFKAIDDSILIVVASKNKEV